jgi:hypothetical protein
MAGEAIRLPLWVIVIPAALFMLLPLPFPYSILFLTFTFDAPLPKNVSHGPEQPVTALFVMSRSVFPLQT